MLRLINPRSQLIPLCRPSPHQSHPGFLTTRGFFSRFGGGGKDSKEDAPSKEPKSNEVEVLVQKNETQEQQSNSLSNKKELLVSPHVLALPTHRRPIFPGVVYPMTITDPHLTKALTSLKESGQNHVGLFLKKDQAKEGSSSPESNEEHSLNSLSEIHAVGSYARIDTILPLDNLSTQVLLLAQKRIVIDGVHDEGPPLRVKVRPYEMLSSIEGNGEDEGKDEEMRKALSNEIVANLRELVKLNPLFKEHMQFFSQRIDIHDPMKLADFAASVTTANQEELQDVLEELVPEKRLRKSLELIMKELQLSQIQQTIKQQVEEKVSEQQKKYFLMEQLKVIQKQLGLEKDEKEALLQKFSQRIEGMPSDGSSEARKVIDEEMAKLRILEKTSMEFNMTRTYLDWLTSLPWSHTTTSTDSAPPMKSLKEAQQILDEDHFGLKDVKERLLEFLAVSKLNSSSPTDNQRPQSTIFCLVGAPGVGKTSIGSSLAKASGRDFQRISVGGLRDVAEIKGHRRSYVGALPGKFVQVLKKAQTTHLLILLDEIDKLASHSSPHGGDPASALLEVLDPSQNQSFLDHYLDVPIDLSNVLFVCTANVTETIPSALLDRMEVIRLAGYDLPEKENIARQYLEPRMKKQAFGNSVPDQKLTDDALDTLISQYCREAGVRSLQQFLSKIYRKLALKKVQHLEDETQENEDADKDITKGDLVDYLGQPRFTSNRMYTDPPCGVVMGLAWTALGGVSLYIETTTIPKSINSESKEAMGGNLKTTGQIGSVMEESTSIAQTLSRHQLMKVAPENDFFERMNLHLHVPEGATPKDGPSAGVTMVTALLSLALNRPVSGDVAMTGEVSLGGKVLPVGGIKEKVIAARRADIRTICLPEGNRSDFNELPSYLKENLTVVFAEVYEDIYQTVFPSDSS